MKATVDILVQILHFTAGLIVVAESLNKIERTKLLARGRQRGERVGAWLRAIARARSPREHLVIWLKGIAWLMLCVGGGGAVITPMLHLEKPTPQDMLLACGFAILIIRTRVKEG